MDGRFTVPKPRTNLPPIKHILLVVIRQAVISSEDAIQATNMNYEMKVDKFWLRLVTHFDAARLAPRAWLTALWWRVQGKKLRARALFAPLLAASRRAYDLWLLTEPIAPISNLKVDGTIIAIVSEGVSQDRTIASLSSQGISVLVMGTTGMPNISAIASHIDWSTSPWLMPLIAGDMLAPGAGSAYLAAISHTHGRIIYADDDIINGRGRRIAPHFKPSWNFELFRHFDYLTGSCIVKAKEEDLLGLSEQNWQEQIVSKMIGDGDPLRLPRVLHHRRSRPAPRLPAALSADNKDLPRVSIIVPTRNRVDLLRKCLNGLERTNYHDMEVIVIDNDSDDPATLAYLTLLDPALYRVLRHPGPFNFSALNNRAAEVATGKLLCLLNNDIEVIDPGWLKTMAIQAQRPEVGAVGAQLLYPDGRIQHAGVVIGVGGGAAHAHRLIDPDNEGYFWRHAMPQFVSAVTAACLVLKTKRYQAVGGLDEVNFPVAFNDVDLCMRLNAQGWQSFYEPRAKLIHHESLSRGYDHDPVGSARLSREIAALQRLWKTSEMIDPYHHPQLSRFSERFVVRV